MSYLVSHFSGAPAWSRQRLSRNPWLLGPKYVSLSCQLDFSHVSVCPHAQRISLCVSVGTTGSAYARKCRSPSRRVAASQNDLNINLALLRTTTFNLAPRTMTTNSILVQTRSATQPLVPLVHSRPWLILTTRASSSLTIWTHSRTTVPTTIPNLNTRSLMPAFPTRKASSWILELSVMTTLETTLNGSLETHGWTKCL